MSHDEGAATHLIIAGHFMRWRETSFYSYWELFIAQFARAIKKYRIKSILLTRLTMYQEKLITKEKMESYFPKDELSHDANSTAVLKKQEEKMTEEKFRELVFDDLEFMFENLKLGLEEVCLTNWDVQLNFFPKLTEAELKLIAIKDIDYLKTFENHRWGNVDVDDAEMELSESKAKYARGRAYRYTTIIDPEEFSRTREELGHRWHRYRKYISKFF